MNRPAGGGVVALMNATDTRTFTTYRRPFRGTPAGDLLGL